MAPHVGRFLVVGLALRLVLAVALAVASLPLGARDSVAQANDRIAVTRLHGPDRYATSLAVAERFVQESGGSIDTVVVVSGQSWRDAAIGTGLAGVLDAPLLLVPPDNLPLATAEFLASAGVSKVIAIGAPDVLSNAVLARFAGFAGVERIWKSDPIATSIAIAKRMGTPGVRPGSGRTAVLANVESVANVHLLAPFSARGRHPVLLTSPTALDERVKSYLKDSGVQFVKSVAGFDGGIGADALSRTVFRELLSIGVHSQSSISYPTSQSLSIYSSLEGVYSDSPSDRCFDRSTVGLATGLSPFDAFSAGPLLGKLCAPLYVSAPDAGQLSVMREIRDNADVLVVIGGEAAVSSQVLTVVDEAAARQSLFTKAETRRAEISAALSWRVGAGAYGVDGSNVLRGPAGFRIDLGDCPSDWSDDTGATESEVKIGLVLPKTGPWSHHGLIEKGMQNYVDWVNKNDPIADRKITLVSRDDAAEPLQTMRHVDSLIKSERVFSVMTMAPTTTLDVYDRIGAECVPHPLARTSHDALGDPKHRPWTTGMTMSQTTEARLWGAWIAQKFSSVLPVRVAALVTDDEFSRPYQHAFESWADRHPEVVSDFLAVRHKPNVLEPDAEMSEIAAFGPNVFITMTSGNACWRAIPPAHRAGLVEDIESKHGALLAASGCRTSMLYPNLSVWAFHDWWIVGSGLKDSDDPTYRNEPFVSFMRENLGLYRDTTGYWAYDTGYWYMYPYVEALRIAATLPGGLTRTNFILAIRSLDITHPLVIDGVRFAMNGNDDAYFIEGARFHQFDAETKALIAAGPVIDINGQTPNCVWDRASDRCG